MKMRTGIGVDVHPLVEGRRLVLGGVEVPYRLGLDGHSDGDVLAHAVIDAMLGAAGLGDIGDHFPPGDPRYKGIESLELVARTVAILAARRWRATYVDATIVAQRPKLKPHLSRMSARLASALGVSCEDVNVKATTTDGLGFAGRSEGIAGLAVATVEKIV